MPATGATARQGVLIYLRLAVRSPDKKTDGPVTGFHHSPIKQYRGGRPGSRPDELDPKKITIREHTSDSGQHVRPRLACRHACRIQGNTGILDATEILMRFFGECRRAILSSGTGTLPDRDRLPSTLGPDAGPCLVDGIGGS